MNHGIDFVEKEDIVPKENKFELPAYLDFGSRM